jgi:hypothetical protein
VFLLFFDSCVLELLDEDEDEDELLDDEEDEEDKELPIEMVLLDNIFLSILSLSDNALDSSSKVELPIEIGSLSSSSMALH